MKFNGSYKAIMDCYFVNMHWLFEETDCLSFETFDTIWLTHKKMAIDKWLFYDNFWPYIH